MEFVNVQTISIRWSGVREGKSVGLKWYSINSIWNLCGFNEIDNNSWQFEIVCIWVSHTRTWKRDELKRVRMRAIRFFSSCVPLEFNLKSLIRSPVASNWTDFNGSLYVAESQRQSTGASRSPNWNSFTSSSSKIPCSNRFQVRFSHCFFFLLTACNELFQRDLIISID